jgi:hypothetical protein
MCVLQQIVHTQHKLEAIKPEIAEAEVDMESRRRYKLMTEVKRMQANKVVREIHRLEVFLGANSNVGAK